MFKHYLTYQFAVGFERACSSLEISAHEKEELTRCVRAMLHHLTTGLHAQSGREKSKSFFVALTYLRDCKWILDLARVNSFDIRGPYRVVEMRLERLTEDAAGKAEGGQLRMFG